MRKTVSASLILGALVSLSDFRVPNQLDIPNKFGSDNPTPEQFNQNFASISRDSNENFAAVQEAINNLAAETTSLSSDGDAAVRRDIAEDIAELRRELRKAQEPSARQVPVGAIVPYYGSPADLPDGWAICNGDDGTPDLTGRFLMGAERGRGSGEAGGRRTHSLTFSKKPKGDFPNTIAGGSASPFIAIEDQDILPPYIRVVFIMRRK